MEPEGSLPHSQAFTNCTYPGPAQSSPYTHINLLEIRPNIYPSTPKSSQWSLSIRFPHQDPIYPLFSPIRATCPAHLILLDFITRTIYHISYILSHNISCIYHIDTIYDMVCYDMIYDKIRYYI